MPDTRRVATCLLTFSVLWLGGRFSSGQEVAAEADPEVVALESKVSQFLEGISDGQVADAYDELLDGSQLKLKEKEKALADLIVKTETLDEKYGGYRSFEKVASKRIGRDLVLVRYLYKCEHFPVVWYFTFYRTLPSNETTPENAPWRVIAVRFDTRLDLLWL